jgi:diguanylate cyclase (GGDEF)-like protein
MTALIYYILTSDPVTSRFFILLRESASVLFLIVMPLLIGEVLVLKPPVKRINTLLLGSAVILSAAIIAAAFWKPGLFIGEFNNKIQYSYRQIVVIQEYKPLYIFKDIVVMLYLVYGISVFFHSHIYAKTLYPVKKFLFGLLVLLYFVLSGFYSILFYNSSNGYVSYYYPHMSTGIAVFIMFSSFTTIDAFTDYISQLIKTGNRLKGILYDDPLLGIPNRNSFVTVIQLMLDDLKAGGGTAYLLFIDIDDFQHINESFGEKTGDEILRLFTSHLLHHFAGEGQLYRIGGDDFVFILKDITSEDDAVALAGKIISSLRNPFYISGVSYPLTASLGIMQIPGDGDNIATVLGNAYSVMRATKNTKNTYNVFTREMVNNSSKRISMVNFLRTSISMDQFVMFYQPVVDASENIVYAESLLRCTNPGPSIPGPGDFIPLMEKAGLMKDIDDMVIKKTFHDMEFHIKSRFNISINLSSNQLVNPLYSDFLASFAVQHGIEPGQIILEVIENTLIENFTTGRESLLKLKEKGFKIAIDDFGKGFSSLSYLAELPLDIIKVDMAFVESVPGDTKKEAIARHIIELAHSLGLKVVAEGFESREQFEFFRGLGCDNFQGYCFSRPLPLNEFLTKYFNKLLTDK